MRMRGTPLRGLIRVFKTQDRSSAEGGGPVLCCQGAGRGADTGTSLFFGFGSVRGGLAGGILGGQVFKQLIHVGLHLGLFS